MSAIPSPGLRRSLEIRPLDYLAEVQEINRLMEQTHQQYESLKRQALLADYKPGKSPGKEESDWLLFSSQDVIDQSSPLFHQLWALEIQMKRLTKIKKVFSDYLQSQKAGVVLSSLFNS